MSEFVAGLFRATGKPYFSSTGHPGMVRYRAASRKWRITKRPSLNKPVGRTSSMPEMDATMAWDRFTTGFEYLGPALPEQARAFALI